MGLDMNMLCEYITCLGTGIFFLCLLSTPFAYIIYNEVTLHGPLHTILPFDANVYIYINLSLMPTAWFLFILATFLMAEDGYSVQGNIKTFAAVLFSLTIALLVTAIVNVSLFYSLSWENMKSSMRTSLTQYTQNSEIQTAWNYTVTNAKCCGVDNYNDFIANNIPITCPTRNATVQFGCAQEITNSVAVTLSLTMLGMISSVLITISKIFGTRMNASFKKMTTKIKQSNQRRTLRGSSASSRAS